MNYGRDFGNGNAGWMKLVRVIRARVKSLRAKFANEIGSRNSVVLVIKVFANRSSVFEHRKYGQYGRSNIGKEIITIQAALYMSLFYKSFNIKYYIEYFNNFREKILSLINAKYRNILQCLFAKRIKN